MYKITIYHDKTIPYNSKLVPAIMDLIGVYSKTKYFRQCCVENTQNIFSVNLDKSYKCDSFSINIGKDCIRFCVPDSLLMDVVKVCRAVSNSFAIIIDSGEVPDEIFEKFLSIETHSKKN